MESFQSIYFLQDDYNGFCLKRDNKKSENQKNENLQTF